MLLVYCGNMNRFVKLCFFVTCVIAPAFVNGQELQMSYFGQQIESFSAQKYPRYDNDEDLCALIKVSVANAKDYTFSNLYIVGEPVYKSGEVWLYMAKGATRITISSERFGTKTLNFDASLEKGVTYEMQLKLVFPDNQRKKTFIMADMSFHPSQLSFGAMIGIVAKHGAYLHIQTSDLNFLNADIECDDTGKLLSTGKYPYYKLDVIHKNKQSVTGGYMYRIANPLYIYAGAGYGNRMLAWETVADELVRNTKRSAEGVAIEIGLIGSYKKLALSLGCQTINFKYLEMNLGVGFIF